MTKGLNLLWRLDSPCCVPKLLGTCIGRPMPRDNVFSFSESYLLEILAYSSYIQIQRDIHGFPGAKDRDLHARGSGSLLGWRGSKVRGIPKSPEFLRYGNPLETHQPGRPQVLPNVPRRRRRSRRQRSRWGNDTKETYEHLFRKTHACSYLLAKFHQIPNKTSMKTVVLLL